MNFPGSLLYGTEQKNTLFFEKEKQGHREIGKYKHWGGNENGLRNLDYSGPWGEEVSGKSLE